MLTAKSGASGYLFGLNLVNPSKSGFSPLAVIAAISGYLYITFKVSIVNLAVRGDKDFFSIEFIVNIIKIILLYFSY